jgi:hypothetical protein
MKTAKAPETKNCFMMNVKLSKYLLRVSGCKLSCNESDVVSIVELR